MSRTFRYATLLAVTCLSAYAQSTFGVVLGEIKDSSGAVIRNAKVRLTNTAENTSRDGASDANGNYEFQNVKAGIYQVAVSAPGFRSYNANSLTLVARQTLRVDASLQVGDTSTVVEVTSTAGVIATDNPAISSTLTPEKVLNLPSNIRGSGSTSPYGLLQALPGGEVNAEAASRAKRPRRHAVRRECVAQRVPAPLCCEVRQQVAA